MTAANPAHDPSEASQLDASITPELLDEIIAIAQRIGQDAADLAARRRREGVQVAATKSSAVDVVTEADRETETFIRAELERLRPRDGFFGEETDASASESGITWVVDPIDGTVNYLYGFPNYAVSIAAVTGDPAAEPAAFTTLVGVVVAPDAGETFVAVRGRGAWRNGEPITVGEGPESLDHTLIATGFAYEADRRKMQAETFLHLADRVRDLRRMGAASLDLCAVAVGRLDMYYEFGLKPWDWAAGALIAREAGAQVCGMHPDEPEGRGILVSGHPNVTGEFLNLLRSAATPRPL